MYSLKILLCQSQTFIKVFYFQYHFHDNQFEKYFSGKRGKLKTDAIPTIFDDPVGNKNKESTEVQEDHLFDYTRPEFIDVSQYQDDPLWKSDLNDDSLNMENFLPEEDNLQESNSIVEKLCGEFELPNNIPKSTTVCVDTVNSEYVQATISRTKVLEEQLKKKDKELKATKRLLSKTLKQVKRLKALNEKFRSNSER